MKKYVTYNPLTGLNTEHDSKDAAIAAFRSMVLDMVDTYWHGTPYTVNEYLEDGTIKTYADPLQAPTDTIL